MADTPAGPRWGCLATTLIAVVLVVALGAWARTWSATSLGYLLGDDYSSVQDKGVAPKSVTVTGTGAEVDQQRVDLTDLRFDWWRYEAGEGGGVTFGAPLRAIRNETDWPGASLRFRLTYLAADGSTLGEQTCRVSFHKYTAIGYDCGQPVAAKPDDVARVTFTDV